MHNNQMFHLRQKQEKLEGEGRRRKYTKVLCAHTAQERARPLMTSETLELWCAGWSANEGSKLVWSLNLKIPNMTC